eukprot:SAG31_NODE_13301_length_878_cov_1.516046_2_plen_31_part_01
MQCTSTQETKCIYIRHDASMVGYSLRDWQLA